MDREEPGLVAALKAKFKAIDDMRGRMWSEFLDKEASAKRGESLSKERGRTRFWWREGFAGG
jgi:hypothetical protein